MKNPGRMENVTRRFVATLLSLSMVILFAGAAQAVIYCYSCHGNGTNSAIPIDTMVASSSYRNITTGAVKGNHGTHSDAVTTGKPCARCHGAAATSYASNHPILNHYSVRMAAALGYSRGTAFPQSSSPSLGTCSTADCHFNTLTPNWGQQTANLWSNGKVAGDNNTNCNACHATTALSSGAHAAHITAIGGAQVSCSKCHPDYNDGANGVGTAAFKHATSNTGSIKISFAAAPNNGTGTVATLRTNSTFLTGATSSANCSTVYCHSSGNINAAGTPVAPTTYISIAWNAAAIGCDGCHGGGGNVHPTYVSGTPASQTANSHQKHIDNAFSCDYCHYNTVTQMSIPPTQVRMNDYSGHLNRDVNIRLKLNGGSIGTYNKTAKTCSNTYCHGGPPGPAWGSVGGATCATCHSANSTLPGGHQAHVQTTPLATSYLNMSGNVSSATQYRFSCAACHSKAAGSLHVNGNQPGGVYGPAEVLYGFTSATRKATAYNYDSGTQAGTDPTAGMSYTAGGTGTCATTYCHSDGNGGRGDKTAFTWAVPSSTNRLRCYGCHGAQDWKLAGAQSAQNYSSIRTQAHARHVRGDINTELNVGNGIACYRCHGATVTAAMNSYSTVGAGVLNKRRHVNKMRDYSGVTPNPNGGAAVSSGQFNQTSHVCSNVYCHSNSKSKNPRIGKFANPDAWNSGVTMRKCNYCHGRQGHGTPVAYDSDSNFSRYSSTGVPNYTSGMAGYSTANSHRQHMSAMGTTDYSNTNVCYSCHAQTLDSTTGRSASAAKFRAYSSRHTSGAYNVKMKAAYGGSYNATMGTKTCSATLCHGGVSPKWGANTTNDSCTKCHGTPSASVTTTTKYLVAPPFNTSQGTGSATGTGQVSNDPKVGAHQTHLRFTNGFSNYSTQTFMCENCHGTTLPTDTAHITGLSVPAFQRLATNRGTMSPVWTAASLTCSNTYCHNPAGTGGTLNTGNVGSLPFVSWTAATYLGDTAKTAANCNKCHLSPKDTAGQQLLAGTSNHSGVKIADDCSGCHGHNGGIGGVEGRRHMDGIKYGGGGTSCDGCHSYDEGDWAGAAHNFGGQGQGKGAHAKHINHLKSRLSIVLNPTTDYSTGYGQGNAAAVCGACHTNTLGDHTTGDSSGPRTINFGGVITYKFGPNAPLYNGSYNTSSATNPKSCSNVSCHYFTTPNWSNY